MCRLFDTIHYMLMHRNRIGSESKFVIKQLRGEILKLRTYPIPEPWRPHCMRQEVTHLKRESSYSFYILE